MKLSFMLAVLAISVPAFAAAQEAEPRLLNPQQVITDLDYPDEAMNRLEEGRVSAIVQVNAAGRASGCQIERSSGSRSLDRQTCVLIQKRGQFETSPGTSGLRVAHVTLRWTMPEKPWVRLTGWFSREQMHVEPSGAVTSCTWLSSEGETGKCTPSIAFAPDLVARFVALGGASSPDVIVEKSFTPDGRPLVPAPGSIIFKQQAIRVSVNKAGNVDSCQATTQSPGRSAQDLCIEARGRTFQESAQGVSTKGTYASTIYIVRPANSAKRR